MIEQVKELSLSKKRILLTRVWDKFGYDNQDLVWISDEQVDFVLEFIFAGSDEVRASLLEKAGNQIHKYIGEIHTIQQQVQQLSIVTKEILSNQDEQDDLKHLEDDMNR
jgi:hypothetical protein